MQSLSKEGSMVLALEAMQNHPKLSIRRAANIFGVPVSTLYTRKNGTISKSDSCNAQHKLTESEEEAIAKYILDMDERGMAPRIAGVEDMANLLLKKRGGERVGIHWAQRFITRRQDLKTRLNRAYDFQRAVCEDPELMGAWFDLVRNMRAKYGIQDSDFYNFDETGFMMGVICAGMVVTGAERKGKSKSLQPANREWATSIECVNSEGWCLPPFLILQGVNILAHWITETDLPRDWVIKPTSNGWTDNETGLEWIRHFDKCTKARTKGAYRMLVVDGHESHKSAVFEEFCHDNKIATIGMPPHSSHLLQPLDVGCFGPLKVAYGRAMEDFIKVHITHITKTEFLIAFKAAHFAAMTEKNIQGGFRASGLYPFNPECVISKLDIKVRAQTPPNPPLPATQPWASQTPHNPTETVSQSEFIKSRISNHQGSSPTQILFAAKQLADGATALAHQATLMSEEIRTLRKANEALGKRRRAKKNRLRFKGAVTIEDGQDELDQRDVDEQIMTEAAESRGRDRGRQAGKRQCGKCGKTGHNVRSCQEDV